MGRATAARAGARQDRMGWSGLGQSVAGRTGLKWMRRAGAGRGEMRRGGETQCEMSIITERAEKRGRDQAYSRKRRAGGIICAPANFGFPFICKKRAAPIDRNKPRMRSEGCDVRRNAINPPGNGDRRLSSRLAPAGPTKFKECV